MNPKPDPRDDPATIRREIDQTRQRMDETIDALGQRFKGRHLVDEALHVFRTQQENGNMRKLKNKFSDSADSAYHSVVDTIKAYPVPTALVGAGLAWLIFEKTRSRSHQEQQDEYSSGFYGDNFGNTPPTITDDVTDNGGNLPLPEDDVMAGARHKVGEVADSLKAGATRLRDRTQQAAQAVGGRAREISHKAKEQTQQLYRQSRDRVVSTVETHPLESGLVCLALGFVAGLALPTSSRVRHAITPGARALRDRTHDMVERGKQVARTAAQAVKDEAETQGLTGGAARQITPTGDFGGRSGDADPTSSDQSRNVGTTSGI